jgi:hypothetical protein
LRRTKARQRLPILTMLAILLYHCIIRVSVIELYGLGQE